MLKQFEEKKFEIPELVGLSKKSIEEHLKLYAGYVKNANTILAKIDEYSGDSEPVVMPTDEHLYELGEVSRRFGFEFDGMRNHEYYFAHLAGGASDLAPGAPLHKAIKEEWGSFDKWLHRFKTLATTRGVGWTILYFDPQTKRLLNAWIDEQHLGHLTGLSPVLALDMWEHSYVADYQPSGKKKYIDDFFTNLNWKNVEENYLNASQ